MTTILSILISGAVVVFLYIQVKGLIKDIKARKLKKQESVKNKEAETAKESKDNED